MLNTKEVGDQELSHFNVCSILTIVSWLRLSFISLTLTYCFDSCLKFDDCFTSLTLTLVVIIVILLICVLWLAPAKPAPNYQPRMLNYKRRRRPRPSLQCIITSHIMLSNDISQSRKHQTENR